MTAVPAAPSGASVRPLLLPAPACDVERRDYLPAEWSRSVAACHEEEKQGLVRPRLAGRGGDSCC